MTVTRLTFALLAGTALPLFSALAALPAGAAGIEERPVLMAQADPREERRQQNIEQRQQNQQQRQQERQQVQEQRQEQRQQQEPRRQQADPDRQQIQEQRRQAQEERQQNQQQRQQQNQEQRQQRQEQQNEQRQRNEGQQQRNEELRRERQQNQQQQDERQNRQRQQIEERQREQQQRQEQRQNQQQRQENRQENRQDQRQENRQEQRDQQDQRQQRIEERLRQRQENLDQRQQNRQENRQENRQDQRQENRQEQRLDQQQQRLNQRDQRLDQREERLRDQRQENRAGRVEDLRRDRRERVERGGRVVITEPGNRTIIRENNRIFIRHDEDIRLRNVYRNATIRRERRGAEFVEVIRRPNGVEIVTVRDARGNLIRRVRRIGGRDVILIQNVVRGPSYVEVVTLPAPQIIIPREQYIVDVEGASQDQLYQTLIAPPVERVEGRYSLDQIRQSPALRERMRRIDIDTVTFDLGSWELSDEQAKALTGVAEAIRRAVEQNPNEVFLVEGHTDAVGDEVDNLTLSDRRAETVARILSEVFEVPAENLTTQGYGEQYLKIDTQEAERRNRRVTVRRITPLLQQGDAQPRP